MIKDTDDKKIIFDKNKKFNTNNNEVRNQVNNREIQLNEETVLHACISDITFDDDKITINFLSKDDLEFTYEISKEAETGEIPDYLQINETDIVQLAIKIFTLEAYKVFMNDTTLPEATAINELQAQITTLTNENETLSGQVETLTTEKGTLEGQVENLTTQLQNAPAPLADEVVQLAFDFDLSDLELVPVSFAGPTGQLAQVVVKLQHTYSSYSDKLNGTDTQEWLASMIELESFKVLGDAQTATSGALEFNSGTGGVSQLYTINLSSGSYIDIPQDGLVPVELKLKNKRNNKTITFTETYDTANSQFIGGGGIVDNRDTTTMQLRKQTTNGFTQIKCMVLNSTPHPISGTIDLYTGNTYLDTVTLDNTNYVDYTLELESGTYDFTGYYYGSNEYKPCTNTLSNVEITE